MNNFDNYNPNDQWRNPQELVSIFGGAGWFSKSLLKYKATDSFWSIIESLGITLFVTREYEHLAIALSVKKGKPHQTYFHIPHPSGLVADRKKHKLYLASTRNPNQIYEFTRATAPPYLIDDNSGTDSRERSLLPARSTFHPGRLYLHDLALIDGTLYGNAVGHNAIVRFDAGGRADLAWWPKCIVKRGQPDFTKNHLQLNSIAAGKDLTRSFFTATSDRRRKISIGDVNYPVDKQGVLFSGETGEPVAFGLTRPHSARQYKGKTWVDNSGYGEFGFISGESFEPLIKLPGWTRGLSIHKNIAFVGVSRVIPRFASYAPGLNLKKCKCGIYAIDLKSGNVLGQIVWNAGDQIFALDYMDSRVVSGFPFKEIHRKSSPGLIKLFYSYTPNHEKGRVL